VSLLATTCSRAPPADGAGGVEGDGDGVTGFGGLEFPAGAGPLAGGVPVPGFGAEPPEGTVPPGAGAVPAPFEARGAEPAPGAGGEVRLVPELLAGLEAGLEPGLEAGLEAGLVGGPDPPGGLTRPSPLPPDDGAEGSTGGRAVSRPVPAPAPLPLPPSGSLIPGAAEPPDGADPVRAGRGSGFNAEGVSVRGVGVGGGTTRGAGLTGVGLGAGEAPLPVIFELSPCGAGGGATNAKYRITLPKSATTTATMILVPVGIRGSSVQHRRRNRRW
jgi:hypothetical protein